MYSAVVQEISKRDKSLEDEEHSDQPFEVDNDQLRVIIEADPLTTTQVAKEINIHHSAVVQHLKKIEKVEKHDKWVPHELTTNQKKKDLHFEMSSLILHSNEPFFIWILMCNEN